jgi:hypothetical protein
MRDRTRSVDLIICSRGFAQPNFNGPFRNPKFAFRNDEARATLPVKQLKVTKLVLR